MFNKEISLNLEESDLKSENSEFLKKIMKITVTQA